VPVSSPEVSVVMAIYNGAVYLRESIDSILAQEGVDFEFIIVNDGSTDSTGDILAEYVQNDSRIRVINQENAGLTRALIRGCAEARGKYIARQDCGDVSLPGRLDAQLQAFLRVPRASLVSCGVRTVTDEGHLLVENIPSSEGATEGLLATDLVNVRGPAHHGSTMFPRLQYNEVGGYRKEFYFAQDLDLWSRLAEHGRHIIVEGIYYKALFAEHSISSQFRKQQVATANLIFACALARRNNKSEEIFLAQAGLIRPFHKGLIAQRLMHSNACYFLGCCLRNNGNPAAIDYLWKALKFWPLHLKALAALVRCP